MSLDLEEESCQGMSLTKIYLNFVKSSSVLFLLGQHVLDLFLALSLYPIQQKT